MAGEKSWAEGSWWRGVNRGHSWLLGLLLLFVLLPFPLLTMMLHQKASPPLQQLYLQASRTSCSVVQRPLVLPYVRYATGRYTLPSIADVEVHQSPVRLTLTEAARKAGARAIEFRTARGDAIPPTCSALDTQIQANARAVRTELPNEVIAALGIGALMVVASSIRSRRRARALHRGHALRGPELLSLTAFNQRKAGDGISFIVREGNLAARILHSRGRRAALTLRSQEESSHFLLMGDTGTGKSSLIRQMLEQVASRDEAAIVYDPALEFTPQFYRPERGDRILNPLDTRMPYWCPGDEVHHKAEAMAFAKALFPEDRRDNRFFIESPRKIFARLLSFRPTAQEIARWLQNPDEIDRLLAGTELASMVDRLAASQRAGVLASLSMVADSFQLIPDRADTSAEWSAHGWAQGRRGWLFLTSTPQTIDRLRPLMTVWLDLLLMRLLSGGPPVWVVLDELPTLNKLPKLPEALALARKPNVRLVLGFQGRAQLEARYGPESEAMLSQPATKVFLRTSEPRAAEWISKALGEIEFERLRETVNYDKGLPTMYHRKGHGYSLERQTRPLVLPSEISGLRNLTAYLKSENYVTRFEFAPNPVQALQPALQTRPLSASDWPTRPSDPPGPAKQPDSGPVADRRSANPERGPSERGLRQRGQPAVTIERDPYFE